MTTEGTERSFGQADLHHSLKRLLGMHPGAPCSEHVRIHVLEAGISEIAGLPLSLQQNNAGPTPSGTVQQVEGIQGQTANSGCLSDMCARGAHEQTYSKGDGGPFVLLRDLISFAMLL